MSLFFGPNLITLEMMVRLESPNKRRVMLWMSILKGYRPKCVSVCIIIIIIFHRLTCITTLNKPITYNLSILIIKLKIIN